MINLSLLTKEEIKNLQEKIRPASKTDYVSSFYGGNAWATDTLEPKKGSYPKSEGSFLAIIVTGEGRLEKMQPWENQLGIRPAVKYSEIEKISKYVGVDKNGIICVEYGEYPQTKVEDIQKVELAQALKNGQLKETEKTYSILNKKTGNNWAPQCFGSYIVDCDKPVIEVKEYKDKHGNKYVMRNEEWYKVEPIRWYVDKKNDIAITKKILNEGLLYGTCKIKEFVVKYLSKEIVPSRSSKVKVTIMNPNRAIINLVIDKEKDISKIGIKPKEKVKR